MGLFKINRDPTNTQLRWFAGFWFVALSAIVGNIVLRIFHSTVAAGFVWVVAGLLAIAGLFSPPIIRPVYIGLSQLTFPLGWVLSHVLLAVLYFGVITPIGFLVRRVHSPMQESFDRTAVSYWKLREGRSKDSYVRQF